jgi:hypothetical protein
VSKALRVVIVKPSKYSADGSVERFRKGFMPNSTLAYMRSLTPPSIDGVPVEVYTVDEHVHTDLDYLRLLEPESSKTTLLAVVGVQSHQFHRALDLCAYAMKRGALAVMGGPHPMTCDTSQFYTSGVSFALAEAELIWDSILEDAIHGGLAAEYGADQRWETDLRSPVVRPPGRRDLRRYVVPMLGLYPVRGCPYTCNFCSVIKISGQRIRSQSVDTTIRSLRTARDAGVRKIMFTSDNFNKYPEAAELLQAMIAEDLDRFQVFVQCDTQIVRQEELVELLGRAGCWQMFVGVESFKRETLIKAQKYQNRPERYSKIVELTAKYGIESHFSNIIGFPEDDSNDILHHLGVLEEISPNSASFYILCPIPGTQQYDEFLEAGRIVEKNLDRFDATCLTWKHPALSAADLENLLFTCYRSYYTTRRLASNLAQLLRNRGAQLADYSGALLSVLFHRWSAYKAVHPMSGGVARVKVDSASDYRVLRRSTFGIDLAPLPRSIALPAADAAAR